MTLTTVGSREARQNWRDLLDAVYTGASDIVIERNGKPIAALIPYEDYEILAELLEDVRAVRRARQSPATGRSYEEIRAGLKAKGLLDD